MKRFGDRRDFEGSRHSMPPRTRPGATYPGGKHMRRALAKLAARTRAQIETRASLSRRASKPLPPEAYRLPGSMA